MMASSSAGFPSLQSRQLSAVLFPTVTYDEIKDLIPRAGENVQPQIVGVTAMLLVLSTIAVVLRLLTRRVQHARLALADYLILTSLALIYVLCALIFKAVHLGLGRHIVALSLPVMTRIAKIIYVCEALFPWTNTLVKLSILLLYQSIFIQAKQGAFAVMTKITAVVWVSLCTAATLVFIFQCTPVSYAWESDHSKGCINLEVATLVITILVMILNVVTLVIPIPLVWQLRLSWKARLGICCIFVIGGGDLAICMTRVFLARGLNKGIVDFSWIECTPLILGVAEPCVGLICACSMVIRPLVLRIHIAVHGSFSSVCNRMKGSINIGMPNHSNPPIMGSSSTERLQGLQRGNLPKSDVNVNEAVVLEELPRAKMSPKPGRGKKDNSLAGTTLASMDDGNWV